MDETELLNRIQLLSQTAKTKQSPLFTPGDDCALLEVAAGKVLAISTDIYLSGVHFPPQLDVEAIAWHCLTGAISDLAAIGAEPLALTLAASANHVDWLNTLLPYCFEVSDAYKMRLIGGDISQGPTSLCVTVLGQTRAYDALSRSAAKPDDDIWVSGYLGEAAAGRKILTGTLAGEQNAFTGSVSDSRLNRVVPADLAHQTHLVGRFTRPDARVALGMALQGIASAAIDVSDGLLEDLAKLLTASRCGARINPDALPASSALKSYALAQSQDVLEFICSGGDDYELCFTVAPDLRPRIELIAKQLDLKLSRIGSVVQEPGISSIGDGSLPSGGGWRHFTSAAQST